MVDVRVRRGAWVPVVALSLLLALPLAACGGDSEAPQATPTRVPTSLPSTILVDGEVDAEALAASRDAFTALDDEAQRREVNAVSGRLERELYAVSGLADALGGDEAVETSIAETAAWAAGLADRAAATVRAPARVAPGVRSAALPEPTTFGEGVFGGLLIAMLSADAAVSASNGGEVGEATHGDITIKTTGDGVELTMTASHTDSTGVRTDILTRITEAPCPLPDGSFTAQAHVEIATTTGGGRTGKRATFDVAIAGTVGDNAELIGYDTEYRGQLADFKASRGGYVEIAGAWPREGAGTLGVTRTGGAATDELTRDASGLSTMVTLMVARKLADAARTGWESGRCVELKPTVSAGPSALRPSQGVQIMAAPRSKIDGGKVGGTVTAVLEGQSSITPGSAPADATFAYVAPPKREMRAKVVLESRSRRGVARATVELDTWQPAYVASGQDEVTWGGRVNSLTGGFSVDATFPGGAATFYFDGAREDGGGVEVSGGGSGASLTGGGTYTLTERDDGVVIVNLRVRSCVNVSKICRTTSHQIILTPQR